MPIQVDFFRARQAAWPERYKRANAYRREQDTKRSSAKAQQSAFRKTLPHHAAPACSKRYTHGKFALARNRPRQQQAGYIDAGDQHDQRDRAKEQP